MAVLRLTKGTRSCCASSRLQLSAWLSESHWPRHTAPCLNPYRDQQRYAVLGWVVMLDPEGSELCGLISKLNRNVNRIHKRMTMPPDTCESRDLIRPR
jgi:hypothetical protein